MSDPEVLEWRFPVLLECVEVLHGSGGRGRHTGGDGARRRMRFLRPMTATILSNRRSRPPFGVEPRMNTDKKKDLTPISKSFARPKG